MLATVAGRPFLAHLLDRLARASVREVVLLTGHAADQVYAAFGDRYGGMRLTYSVEPAPLGTAGAVRHALPLFRSETILLMNGDSYCDGDLAAFRRSHAEAPSAFGMVLTRVADASRYGRVEVAADGRVVRFAEKDPAGPPGWINAGIYLFPRALLEGLEPARRCRWSATCCRRGWQRAVFAASGPKGVSSTLALRNPTRRRRRFSTPRRRSRRRGVHAG